MTYHVSSFTVKCLFSPLFVVYHVLKKQHVARCRIVTCMGYAAVHCVGSRRRFFDKLAGRFVSLIVSRMRAGESNNNISIVLLVLVCLSILSRLASSWVQLHQSVMSHRHLGALELDSMLWRLRSQRVIIIIIIIHVVGGLPRHLS